MALQRYVSFHHTTKWISHTYLYIPLPPKPPSHLPIPTRQVITEHWAEPPVLYSSFPLAVFHMVVYIHVIANLPIHPTMPHVHTSVLYVCVSLSALQTLTFYSVTVRSIATTQQNKLQAKPALWTCIYLHRYITQLNVKNREPPHSKGPC